MLWHVPRLRLEEEGTGTRRREEAADSRRSDPDTTW